VHAAVRDGSGKLLGIIVAADRHPSAVHDSLLMFTDQHSALLGQIATITGGLLHKHAVLDRAVRAQFVTDV
jgi:hypothetical protein